MVVPTYLQEADEEQTAVCINGLEIPRLARIVREKEPGDDGRLAVGRYPKQGREEVTVTETRDARTRTREGDVDQYPPLT